MRWIGNISLSIKLTLLILLALGLFLFATISLLTYSTQSFTAEVGNERIQDTITSIQNSVSNMHTEIDTDINLLASDISFFQAVGRRDAGDVSEIITRTNLDQSIYDIDVVDGDNNLLFGTEDNIANELLTLALDEGALTTFLVDETNGETAIYLSGAAPVVSVTGNILGSIKISRQLNDDFLQRLVSEQRRVSVGLLYDGQFVAESGPLPQVSLGDDILTQVAAGEIVTTDVFTSGNIPYAGAYLPITLNETTEPLILVLFVELSQLYEFQSQTLNTTIAVFMLLALVTVGLISIVLYQIAIKPINRLRDIAQDMTRGQYDQRIPVTYQDELGQLAQTFNEMANAVQQREEGLNAARESAERSDQVKSAFLASMSHELRTPLNAVINFTRFVIEGDTGPVNEQQTELLNEVVNSAKHLLNLINDVLDMSKIESGSLNLFIEDDVNVVRIVKTALTTGQGLLAGKPVEIQSDIQEDIPLIRGDKQRLLQVLLNVVSNACKFTDEGKISVRAHQQGGEILIAISDTGPGIAPEDQEMVFEAFKQTTTGLRQGGGTGLGMPIAKSLVEAHGGRMWLKSEYGKGTEFFVSIPVKSEELVPMVA